VPALLVILFEDPPRLFFIDPLAVHFEVYPVLHIGDDSYLEHMADATKEEVAGEAMVDDVVALDLLEKGLLNKRYVSLLAVRKTVQH
jgi:hypothetical protein